ncbi:Protein LIPS-7 a [Aphelenchoides avenae]|nr:Protein LIPS-7 a [Aphelenchus avenae]
MVVRLNGFWLVMTMALAVPLVVVTVLIVSRRPVIYVHGVGQIAADLGVLQWYLHVRGYRDEEVYATSYGEPGRRSKFLVDPMKCDYVKQIRRMIVTVSDYANSTVDVIAFSMGSPIARKAILGGNCVDTGENLGDPLTDTIHSFLGIAGANHGALFCLADDYSECNGVNGLSCESKFLADINSRQHYEGQNVYSLLTTKDQVVGYYVCDQVTTKVPESDRTVTITTQDHHGVLIFTGHIQYNLLYNGTA